jgi:crotonobetainyl-CoA:carnitine CoA-transferase CaiB-like acyl-CoA transferase
VIDAPEFLTDPRFATNGGRFAHRDELAVLIGQKLQTHTSDEWEEILNDNGIPCGPIYTMEQSLEHPQVKHREMVVEMPHPTLGNVRLLGLPVKLSDTPISIRRYPPLFAEHTDDVLRELGLSDMEIENLRASGVINSGHGAAVPTGD